MCKSQAPPAEGGRGRPSTYYMRRRNGDECVNCQRNTQRKYGSIIVILHRSVVAITARARVSCPCHATPGYTFAAPTICPTTAMLNMPVYPLLSTLSTVQGDTVGHRIPIVAKTELKQYQRTCVRLQSGRPHSPPPLSRCYTLTRSSASAKLESAIFSQISSTPAIVGKTPPVDFATADKSDLVVAKSAVQPDSSQVVGAGICSDHVKGPRRTMCHFLLVYHGTAVQSLFSCAKRPHPAGQVGHAYVVFR